MACTIYKDESRRQECSGVSAIKQDDGRAHGICPVWCHGGTDGWPGKVKALIPFGDGFAEDGGCDFYGMCDGAQ